MRLLRPPAFAGVLAMTSKPLFVISPVVIASVSEAILEIASSSRFRGSPRNDRNFIPRNDK